MTMLLTPVAANAANVASAQPRPTETVTELVQNTHALIHATILWIGHNSLRIAIAAAVGALIVLALLGLKSLGTRLCREEGRVPSVRGIIGRVIAKTSFWFMVVLAAELLISYTGAPPLLARTVNILWVIIFVTQVALWLRELAIGVIEHRAGVADQDHSALGSAMGIIRLLVTVTLAALAIILILDNLGVNVTGLIAGLGIGGIAIGLAAKGIFDDLFAALAILFDRPFRQGETVNWDTTTGTVEAIGLKSTRIRSGTGEEVVISNANLLNKELHNMTRLDFRQAAMTFGVIYELPPEKLRAIPAMVGEIVKAVPNCSFIRCAMTGFGASSLDYELLFNVMSSNYADFAEARMEVCLRIIEKFAAEGIAFAYPTQTSYMAAPDGRLVMPWPEPEPGREKGHAGG